MMLNNDTIKDCIVFATDHKSMDYKKIHSWRVSPSQAVALQKRLSEEIQIVPFDASKVRLVAGADISFERFSDTVYAGFVVLDLKTLEIVARASTITEATMPYIPGLLSFREAPALLKAWEKLKVEPDVVVFDGQGIAHPRRIGIASHMGLFLDRPTIGCGKTRLVGTFDHLSEKAGSTAPLVYRGNIVGSAVRTKDRVNPVYVSPGHRIDLGASVELILRCVAGYRIPEPTRQAHLFVNEIRKRAASAA